MAFSLRKGGIACPADDAAYRPILTAFCPDRQAPGPAQAARDSQLS
ncbi:MAG: hypothetical protein LPJ92_00765 [Rhodobacterales bacterium]|nr:hypothetical protein [Rhodobacterales bacterium]MDX5388846.1 hypothetical protein [Rhodobacterales bacterium]MDX5488535.1 hypothetical protein [Rhodobacterales bacterium]